MNTEGQLPHTHLKKGDVLPTCVVVADAARAEQIASICDKSEHVAKNGVYTTYNVTWGGREMTLSSHGQGSPAAALCFEELIQLGAKVILKIGTGGSLRPTAPDASKQINQGDIVLIHSSVREEGVSALMVPPGYPAAASCVAYSGLMETAKEKGIQTKHGMSLSSDLFYKGPALPSTVDTFSKANVEVIDMETATLYVIARIRGVMSAAAVCVSGSPLKADFAGSDASGENLNNGKTRTVELVLTTASKMAGDM
eukprot:Selendium_serpulae@DN4637_c0_g1_i1.p2